jgi:AmiR/NasT family two-component response regulator
MSEEPHRILVVEDQRLIAADLENTLRKLGYVVVGNVASGEDAIGKSDQVRPELVLMDVRHAERWTAFKPPRSSAIGSTFLWST